MFDLRSARISIAPAPSPSPSPHAITMPIERHTSFAEGTRPVPVVPEQLGPYKVLWLLARGGMGGVYLAEHLTTKARVALKVLEPRFAARDTIVTRMLGEREVTRRVHHTGLVRIFGGARIAGGVAYLAMELLDGEDLGALSDRGRVELGAAIAIGAQIADAVSAMHTAEIVHCDLKPDNIMVEYRTGLAGWPRVKVLDFGVARFGAPTEECAEIAGTPCYMAPEQWRGRAEPRTDVYGLGCMLYELITGDVPFDGTLPQVMTAHTEDVPARISARRWIPETLDRLIMQMLAKRAGARPLMRDVARMLTELAYQLPPGAAAPSPSAASID